MNEFGSVHFSLDECQRAIKFNDGNEIDAMYERL